MEPVITKPYTFNRSAALQGALAQLESVHAWLQTELAGWVDCDQTPHARFQVDGLEARIRHNARERANIERELGI